jgi:2-oxoglutarate dehydrogenase E1 component
VIDDTAFADASRDGVKRIVLTSGKVFYDLKAARDASAKKDVALVRLEQFYPWPKAALSEIFSRYPNANEIVWTQEEPRNMGGWNFVAGRFALTSEQRALHYAGRPISASPATGSHHRHEEQQKALVDLALVIA